jgi:hypothetical protein
MLLIIDAGNVTLGVAPYPENAAGRIAPVHAGIPL